MTSRSREGAQALRQAVVHHVLLRLVERYPAPAVDQVPHAREVLLRISVIAAGEAGDDEPLP